MGKRSDFERNERDYYPTPIEAVQPLLSLLPPEQAFIEPCAGDGRLVRYLETAGHTCVAAYDIEPQADGIAQADMFDVAFRDDAEVVTNPPWDRKVLHPLITKMIDEGTSGWLLFDYGWSATQQAIPFMQHVRTIMPIGRVRWIPGSKDKSKDAVAWHRIEPDAGATTLITPMKVAS